MKHQSIREIYWTLKISNIYVTDTTLADNGPVKVFREGKRRKTNSFVMDNKKVRRKIWKQKEN